MRLSFLALLVAASPLVALDPAAVVVVGNANVPASKGVAEHYVKVRGVPAGNLLMLDLPAGETIPWADYGPKLADPLRAFLADKPGVACVLTVHGVPLKIGRTTQTPAEAKEAAAVRAEQEATKAALAAAEKATPRDAAEVARLKAASQKLAGRAGELDHGETEAAVDSEVMLLFHGDYETRRFQPNPQHFGFKTPPGKNLPRTLMTCRLDGPTAAVAKRLVDDAVAVEAAGGLKGTAYVDARGITFDPAKKGESGTGYEGYDESFRETAAVLKRAKFDVVLDDKDAVFAPQSCPEAALYTGWYSAGKFVDSNTFVKGAVAWHLASYELGTMQGKTLWVPNLLNAGAAVTLGPVHEPYTVGFPKPAEFFGFLATGELTVVECYAKTVPLTSWMGVLIGDPLYNPFRGQKRLKMEDVKLSPGGMPYPLQAP